MPFITVDFEASCLPQYGQSFPIEVGIASSAGWSRSWLIRPHARWASWQWAVEAEALHGITRERLEREGIDAAQVAAMLREAVGDDLLIADSYFDDDWCRTLFEAAGERDYPPVHCLADLRAFHDVSAERLTRAMAEADFQRARRHRAEDDARWLARLLSELDLDRPEQAMPVPVEARMAVMAGAR